MLLLRHVGVALTAVVAALGSALFIALSYFYRRRQWSPVAQYCPIKEEDEDAGKRQVLVLGLDGAGKSSMLQGLTPGQPPGAPAARAGHRPPAEARGGCCGPTRGFNFMSLSVPRRATTHRATHRATQLHFLEIGGGENLRGYWSEYLRRTHVLVYVVDSSDRRRLPLAKAELHRLLRVEPRLPVVVLGNKQDMPGAVGVPELHEALSLGSVSEERRLYLLASQLRSDDSPSSSSSSSSSQHGLRALQDLLLQLV